MIALVCAARPVPDGCSRIGQGDAVLYGVAGLALLVAFVVLWIRS